MAEDPYQVACERYKDLIPRDCFGYEVPLWLQHTQDHSVFPSSDLRAPDGFQWMRVSRFRQFVKACKSFAVEQGANSTLRVLVMPYMPPRDASLLEDMLIDLPPVDGDQEGGEGEEEVMGPWDMKTGNARFQDVGLNVEVVVMNYGLLRSKASLYYILFSDYDEMMSRIEKFGENFERYFVTFPDGHLDTLQAAAKQARIKLLFAMVDGGKQAKCCYP